MSLCWGIIMDLKRYIKNDGEKPLDNITLNGGMCRNIKKYGPVQSFSS